MADVDILIKELEYRDNAFLKCYNFIHDETKPITQEDLDTDDYEDLRDLCELYYQLRTGKLQL